ncbi:MAG: hypothetical protein WBD71_17190, partial [Xanthobacteraceae bacterium]
MSGIRTPSPMFLENWRNRVKDWHQVTREPGLTALLVLQSVMIFLIVPLTGMGELPSIVLPTLFIVLVLTIL